MQELTTPAGSERRIELRKPFRGRVRLGWDKRAPLELRAFDISSGGMGVECDVNLPTGIVCNLAFTLVHRNGTTQAIEADARIVHTVFSGTRGSFVVGLEFRQLPEDTIAALRRYVRG